MKSNLSRKYDCTQRHTYGHTCSFKRTQNQPPALFDMSALVRVQLVANAVLFTSVNLSGVFVRILTERTQRKVFLQARNCIEERLRLEDENEKQVRRESAYTKTHRERDGEDMHPPRLQIVTVVFFLKVSGANIF